MKTIGTDNGKTTERYRSYSDEKLCALAGNGDDAALDYIFRNYRDIIKSKANLYFLVGGDKDDLIQEGMIGLFGAIMNYKEGKDASFRTFAELCIGRQMMTAVKSADRLKHSPLNSSVSIYNAANDRDENAASIEETFADRNTSTPEEEVLIKDQLERIERDSAQLFSKLELAVWNEYKIGKTYTEIARSMGKSSKTIDNALQRMKKKVETHMKLY
ncbi:MAG: sigma-70 family RNA polymerase sigma factor [Clostridiales Family XIII bacterium]|jgi:RNA polymerase sporulation-specific sigma factor|nr:sigma-70 family RNA polymerase sigma factor [Clostridiales Family XIII bacterium]